MQIWGARIAISVGSLLYDWIFGKSKEEKIKEAQDQLCEDLSEPSFEILEKMHNSVIDTFNNEILGKGVDEFSNMLAEYCFILERLGKDQGDMAHALFKEYEDLNFRLLNEAIEYKNAGRIRNFESMARIPGETMTVFANGRNLNTAKLSDLLGEVVTVVNPCANAEDTLKLVLHSDLEIISYPLKGNANEEYSVVLLEDNVNTTSYKIAQQVSRVPIIMKNPPPAKKTTAKSSNSYNAAPNFEQVENLLSNPRQNKNAIANILKNLEQTAESQRDADAMEKIADYYSKIRNFSDAARCSELAENFAQENSNSDNDEFRAGFEQVENLLSNPRKNKNAIANILKILEQTAETQRNADAMEKIADYYGAIRNFGDAERCQKLAENGFNVFGLDYCECDQKNINFFPVQKRINLNWLKS